MSDALGTPTKFFTADHRSCDALWSEVEAAVEDRDSDRARQLWESFHKRMRRHFDMEEKVLFPALEEVTGVRDAGPTAVMRMEHDRMRRVLEQMDACAVAQDLHGLLDHGDSLLMLVQQHNVKEENILYPMCDASLADRWEQLAATLQNT